MGPDNPWSPNWRPDPSGDRLIAIRAARRGALLAGVIYLPIAASVLAMSLLPDPVVILALVVGLPGVALLGAGLGPSTIGDRTDALVTGVAFAIGAPVAAVTSIVIGALVVGAIVPIPGMAGTILQTAILTAIAVAPVVAVMAAIWVVVVRRLSRPRVGQPSSSPP